MRMLLVVQHALLSDALAAVLAGRGHDVAECHGAADAVPTTLDHRPDTVLLDASLPGIEAEAVGRFILEARPDTVLVALDADGAAESTPRTSELGCSASVSSDASLDQLLFVLETAGGTAADRSLGRPGGA